MLIVHQFKVQESKFSYPNHIRKLNPVKDNQPVGHRVGQRAFLKSLTMKSTLNRITFQLSQFLKRVSLI